MVCLYNGLAHPPGYPLFTLICPAFSQISWLDPVISGNLISALFAALAGALIFNVVPTFREVETIGNLILAVDRVMEDADLRYELLVVDDDSQDGTDQVVAELGSNYPVLLIDRKGKIRDLSESVLDGISEAANDIVVGSRYVSGGSFDREWNFW